jgi:transposase-like protein
MFTGFKNITELLDHFKDQKTCIEFLEQMRWDGRPTCPYCNFEKVYRTKTGFRCAGKGCCKKFSVLVNTIYENTKIPLRLWFAAIYLGTTHKKGINSVQLAEDLNITQRSAWFMMHRIREAMKESDEEIQLKGTVEIDETYVGGKNKNRHKDKRIQGSQGRSAKDKVPVVGLLERDGKVRTFVVPNTEAEILHPLIDEFVDKDAIIVTDGYRSYNGMNNQIRHIVVKHQEAGYVTQIEDKKFHTQNIENFWSVFKRGYYGTYQYMSRKHMHRYFNEFASRYNNRKQTAQEKFELTIKQANGRRLTWNTLTRK